MGGFAACREIDAHHALVPSGKLELGRLAENDRAIRCRDGMVEAGGGEMEHAIAGRFLANDEEESEVGGGDARVGLEKGQGGVDLGGDTCFVVYCATAGDEKLRALC